MSMTTTAVAGKAMPLGKKKYKSFNVSPDVFKRFLNKKYKPDSWVSLLDEKENLDVIEFVKQNSNVNIFLKNEKTGKLKLIRRTHNE